MGDFTRALADLRSGVTNTDAVNALFEITYEDLKQLAHQRLRRSQPLTALDTTSLVHESYLRFQKAARLDLEDRTHFIVYAAKVMRSVVIDMARRRSAERRGGDDLLLTLNTEVKQPTADPFRKN